MLTLAGCLMIFSGCVGLSKAVSNRTLVPKIPLKYFKNRRE